MQIVLQNMPRFMASLIVQFWSTNEKTTTSKLDYKEISYSPDPTMNSKFGFNEFSKLSRISYKIKTRIVCSLLLFSSKQSL